MKGRRKFYSRKKDVKKGFLHRREKERRMKEKRKRREKEEKKKEKRFPVQKNKNSLGPPPWRCDSLFHFLLKTSFVAPWTWNPGIVLFTVSFIHSFIH